MTTNGQRLEKLSGALTDHEQRCGAAVIEIHVNPFDHEVLGWDEFKGIPLVANEKVQPDRVRVVCERMRPPPQEIETSEAIGEPITAPA